MSKQLLSGNEAIAQGAWEAGVAVGTGYPGTPSTETLENLVKKDGVYCEWSPNEKVALEVAIGAAMGGVRTLATMKHVGVNVAADPLLSVANAGVNGGPAGDLIVEVRVRPHAIFERRGNDIWCEFPITFVQASLGGEIIVPTLDGKVSYNIHEGTQPGDVFKLKGRGIPSLNTHIKGDQYVRVTVEVPKNLSDKQKDLLRQFEEESGDKNYQKRRGFLNKLKTMFGGNE
jgi:molecular chaperone DnaJ